MTVDSRSGSAVPRWVAALLAPALLLASCQRVAEPSASSPLPSTTPAASATPLRTSSPRPTAAADLGLEVVAGGLRAPLALVAPPDEDDRLFVVDQTGLILVLRDGQVLARPFLDLSSRLVDLTAQYDERGLLALAFDPAFTASGRLFVYYTAPVRNGAPEGQDHTNVLSEFRVSADDPDRADPASERILLQFEQPQPSHSGGALGIGPDGFLYLGVGDGGGRGDADAGHSPQGNAQDREKLNGKVIRLDIGEPGVVAIPPDNPFADGGGRPEIYAYGFRNPWRLSWEPDGERRLIVSDVGYGRFEEIDVVTNGGNYGWRIREGAHCLDVDQPLTDVTDCPTTGEAGEALIDPVLEYTHREVGVAVVGGYVYRGTAIPALSGTYVFADFSKEWTSAIVGRGSVLLATRSAGGDSWDWRRADVAPPVGGFITGMGEDQGGELYLLRRQSLGPVGDTGEVVKLVPPS